MLNVFGESLEDCSQQPITGFFRDGCCQSTTKDRGAHITCAVMTEEFLKFSYLRGNDLITPRPELEFNGLKSGDKWCLCVIRWIEAYQAGVAPKIYLEATHEKMLEYLKLEELVKFAHLPRSSNS